MGENERRTVLLIGGRVETVRKARELGLRVVNVQRPEEYRLEHAEMVDAALLVDYTDWSVLRPLVVALHEVYGICGVATITEPGVEPAARVAELLGLPGNSPHCARLMRDKAAMRAHLAGRAGAVAAALVRDRASLAAFGEQQGYPFIVKPVDAAASFGVRRVDGPEAVGEAWEAIVRLRGSTEHPFAVYFPVGEFLMEEYLQGPEYSVESFTFDGRHLLLTVTEKATYADFIESGHALPARLPPADERVVRDCVTAFLDTVELRHGPAHTEVKLTPNGPQVIESHGRPGGDRIMELVDAAYGVDIEAWTVGWAVGALTAPETIPAPHAAAATRFLIAEPGRVTGIEGTEEVRAHEGVIGLDVAATIGGTVRPLKASWDRVGQILVTAPDTSAAVALAEQLAQKIIVTTAPNGA